MDWVAILSQLELCFVAGASGRNGRRQVLGAVNAMMVVLIDFVETRFPEGNANSIRRKVVSIYDEITELENHLKRAKWGFIGIILGMTRASTHELEVSYRNVRDDVSKLIQDVFGQYVRLYQIDDDVRKSVVEGTKSLISEMNGMFQRTRMIDLALT